VCPGLIETTVEVIRRKRKMVKNVLRTCVLMMLGALSVLALAGRDRSLDRIDVRAERHWDRLERFQTTKEHRARLLNVKAGPAKAPVRERPELMPRVFSTFRIAG
jgi:hypothetical protein